MQHQKQLLTRHYLLHTFSYRLTQPPPLVTCRNSNLESQQMSVHFGEDVAADTQMGCGWALMINLVCQNICFPQG